MAPGRTEPGTGAARARHPARTVRSVAHEGSRQGMPTSTNIVNKKTWKAKLLSGLIVNLIGLETD